jgi:hypothetical protein
MKILINDILQSSDAPEALISPALADTWEGTGITVTLDASRTFDCVGIGYTDATAVTVNGTEITIPTVSPYPDSYKNGLFVLPSQTDDEVVISHDGTYIGRLALGTSRSIYASPSREPGFYTTSEPRVTAAGQVIAGAGGYSGRRIDLDFRYKIDRDIFQDIQDAYASQVSKGFPFFLYFDKETGRMPWTRLYASTDNNLLFQSSVNRFLYSRRFAFTERF